MVMGYSTDKELNKMLENMEDEEGQESPYCEKCTACGISECCSPLQCFSKLVKDDKCKHGSLYLLDIELALEFSDWVLGYLNNANVLTSKDAYSKYHAMLDRIYKKGE